MLLPTIKETDVELSLELRDHLNKKIEHLERLVNYKGETRLEIEVGMATHHHQKGRIYRAEFQMHVPRTILRSEAVGEELRKAIDCAFQEIEQEVKRWKEKLTAKNRRIT